ncbi:MAG: polymer-forming cytoskeletal protein [Gemmatimonadaceae bacterium]
MAIFAKDVNDRNDGRSAAQNGEGVLSLVGVGMKITGDIESSGVVKIEGTVEGCIRAARQVLLGRQGEITGDVHAREIVVGGRVTGNIYAAERIEVQGTSSVHGDIHTRTIVVLEGARINGLVKMEDAGVADDRDDAAELSATPAVAVMR